MQNVIGLGSWMLVAEPNVMEVCPEFSVLLQNKTPENTNFQATDDHKSAANTEWGYCYV